MAVEQCAHIGRCMALPEHRKPVEIFKDSNGTILDHPGFDDCKIDKCAVCWLRQMSYHGNTATTPSERKVTNDRIIKDSKFEDFRIYIQLFENNIWVDVKEMLFDKQEVRDHTGIDYCKIKDCRICKFRLIGYHMRIGWLENKTIMCDKVSDNEQVEQSRVYLFHEYSEPSHYFWTVDKKEFIYPESLNFDDCQFGKCDNPHCCSTQIKELFYLTNSDKKYLCCQHCHPSFSSAAVS